MNNDNNEVNDKIENWAKPIVTLLDDNKESSKQSTVNSSQDLPFKERNSTIQSLTKKKFLISGQWSQEENTDDATTESTSKPNGHVSFNHDETESSSDHLNCSKQCYTHNNNLVIEKSNLRCSDEKACCIYMKFPMKVNNNVYPEKNLNMKDGMEDYFEQFSLNSQSNKSVGPCEEVNDVSRESQCNDYYESENFHQDGLSYPDQINALNGEDDDEDDSCIYTYKGDNYEANLSHLLQTCFSCGLPTVERAGNQNGAISIQRILNGSPHPNPNPQSNLYSPEMDFLEMDFDPGSNGDGGDSDYEDNNRFNLDSKVDENTLEDFSKLSSSGTSKTSNIPNELRSLMCRRCELCSFNEQKVNNTASNLSIKTNTDSNLTSNLQSSLDDRPLSTNSFDDPQFSQQNLNVKIESNSSDRIIAKESFSKVSSSQFLNRHCESKEEPVDNVENNLNVSEKDGSEEFSDGDEADDERDDSNSDPPPPLERSSFFIPSVKDFQEAHKISCTSNDQSFLLLNSKRSNKQLRFSPQNNCSKSSPKSLMCQSLNSNAPSQLDNGENYSKNSDDINCESNNNLGSISAPEVSPSKEYSPLEKFTRSISFHNQLSSPKYENVCLSHSYKDNFFPPFNKYQATAGNSFDYCNCKNGSSACKAVSQSSETTNLEACVDRLTQREKSVFNITSNSLNSSQDYTVISNYAFNSTTLTSSEENASEKASILCSLPGKNLQPKMADPFRDPNTISEDDLDKEQGVDSGRSQIEKVMIWTERQATFRQVSQVGTSACGPTAVINILSALDHSRTVKTVTSAIKTRLRAENAPLVEYILSRSNAGTTHQDLIKGIEGISENSVKGRFFHMFPKRAFQLSRWLSGWIKKGGVPLATLNLQVGVHPGQTVPDAWHHQMVFGVGPQGIYLTNPLECVSDSLLSDQLCSDSVLLVRRSDVVSRWDQKDKIIQLSLQSDPRWNDMNVLGQVVCVLKEEAAPEMLQGRRHMTSHVSIPASYQSGVSIFVRSDNPCLQELVDAPELPLLDE